MKQLWTMIACIGLSLCFGISHSKAQIFAATEISPMSTVYFQQSLATETMMYEAKNDDYYVRHHVHGNNVFVECYFPNFSFKQGGYINLFIDNRKSDKINTAAFIIRGLPPGNHTVKLEMIRSNATKASLQKQFNVHIE